MARRKKVQARPPMDAAETTRKYIGMQADGLSRSLAVVREAMGHALHDGTSSALDPKEERQIRCAMQDVYNAGHRLRVVAKRCRKLGVQHET